jgi:hypothetical protein
MSPGGETAIDWERNPCDEAGVIVREVKHAVCNVVGPAGLRKWLPGLEDWPDVLHHPLHDLAGQVSVAGEDRVAINPGQMQLTLIPCAANSTAAHLVRKTTADFATE